MKDKLRYGAIDGLRTIAAVGIVMMHIRANNTYTISGFLYNNVIPSFTDFVFLFMVLSAFGMCCGYHEKILNSQISFPDFYRKRWKRIFPFFAVLVVLDVVVSPSIGSVYEGFADLTLLFGFLPNAGNISVIGVGWFLGLVFVFYLIFPFFCVLLENKRRAWVIFVASLLYNFACTSYFEVGRTNILYSASFFVAGGLIYLYREEIERLKKRMVLGILCVLVFIYYVAGKNVVIWLLISATLLLYAILRPGGALENRFTKFFSSISMEVYLSHMFIFRVIEKLGLNVAFGDGWIQYAITVAMVVTGAIAFSFVMRIFLKFAEGRIKSKARSGM